MGKRPLTVGVTRRALVARIQRALARRQHALHTDRRGRQTRWLVINDDSSIADMDVDLEELGRELGVLRPWEKLEAD